MPSDVLQSLLGLLAGAGETYVNTKENRRAETAKASEAERERGSRKDLLQTELTARAQEGAAERLSRKELTTLQLQAEKDNLEKQLNANRDRAAASNQVEREKLDVQREEIEARLKQVTGELALKSRELDIEQASKLGTGKLGGGLGQNTLLSSLPDLLKAYISGRSPDMKPEEAIGFLRTVINTNFQNQPVGQGPFSPGYGGNYGVFGEENNKGGSNQRKNFATPYPGLINAGVQTGRFLSNPMDIILDSVMNNSLNGYSTSQQQYGPYPPPAQLPVAPPPQELNFGFTNPNLRGLIDSTSTYPSKRIRTLK